MAKATKADETVTVESEQTDRAQEAQQALDAQIDRYIAIYNAVVAKVSSEHMQAAIFAAIVAEK